MQLEEVELCWYTNRRQTAPSTCQCNGSKSINGKKAKHDLCGSSKGPEANDSHFATCAILIESAIYLPGGIKKTHM
jgi:hypothetical protein